MSSTTTQYRATLQGNIPLTEDEIAELQARAAQALVPVPPTVQQLDDALTAHLDATAQARRYKDRITCMARAGFAGPYQAEAQAFGTWADTCNAMAYGWMGEVQAGTRPMPATTQELIDALPPMVWPT